MKYKNIIILLILFSSILTVFAGDIYLNLSNNSSIFNVTDDNIIINITNSTTIDNNITVNQTQINYTNLSSAISNKTVNETNFTMTIQIAEFEENIVDYRTDINISENSTINFIALYYFNYLENETYDVIIKVKEDKKDKIKTKISKDKLKTSKDKKLVFSQLSGFEVKGLLNDSDVDEIWLDLMTQSFITDSTAQINADFLWDLGYTGTGVKIAILDTGLDMDHEMFDGRTIVYEDFTGSGSAEDGQGHGTHVAGIALGNGQYVGVANEADIYVGKVLDDSGSGQLSWLINGIDWAIENNVDVISLSLGAVYSVSAETQLSSPEILKIEEAIANGITVVIASGNCASGACGSFTGVTTPGIAEHAITVGAVDSSNEWAYFSSGSIVSDYIKPDLVAPGVGICSSVVDGYDCKSGTSMATPFVAGAASLLLEYQDYTPAEMKMLLESNSVDLGTVGKDVKYGSGLLNLDEILDVVVNVTSIEDVDNVLFSIPTFVTGQSDSIAVKYIAENETNVVVSFEIEDIDDAIVYNESKTVVDEDIFVYDWIPLVPGKYKLKIIVDDEQVVQVFDKEINVMTNQVVNVMNDVRLMVRG